MSLCFYVVFGCIAQRKSVEEKMKYKKNHNVDILKIITTIKTKLQKKNEKRQTTLK